MKNLMALLACIGMVLTGYKSEESRSVKFIGNPVAKTILQVTYDHSDSCSDSINWFVSASREGSWKELPGIHSREIVLLTDYVGKFLKCEIIPGKNEKNRNPNYVITDSPVVDKGNPNTDWFKNAGIGVMLHFLKDVFAKDGGSKEWNETVDNFDVERFAEDCKKTGAGFVMFALGQNDGYYCSPNAAYDSIVGVKPGDLCSLRDLPADLYQALNKRGIRMMFYLPGNPPIHNRQSTKGFKYTYGCDSPTSQFTQACWEAVIKEWSLRYGKKLSGWWFDGMYRGGIIETRSDMNLAHNISTHTLAAKAGNFNGIVTYNYGVDKIQSDSPYDDFSAGEENSIGQIPENRWAVDGTQWFLFTYLGKWWSGGETRFTTAALTDWSEKVFEKGGVICFDIHADKTGAILPEHIVQVKAVKEKLEAVRKNIQ